MPEKSYFVSFRQQTENFLDEHPDKLPFIYRSTAEASRWNSFSRSLFLPYLSVWHILQVIYHHWTGKILTTWWIFSSALPESSQLLNGAFGIVASVSDSVATALGLSGKLPNPDRSSKFDPSLINFLVQKANGMKK